MAKKIKFSPINDMVVVKRVEVSNVSDGGVVLPDDSKDKSTEGFVIAVGPGRMLDSGVRCKPQVKEDDRVVFGRYAESDLKLGNVGSTFIREDDISSVVEEEMLEEAPAETPETAEAN